MPHRPSPLELSIDRGKAQARELSRSKKSARRIPHGAGEETGWEALDERIEFADVGVVEPTHRLDPVFGVGELLLQMDEGRAGLQLGIAVDKPEEPSQLVGQRVLMVGLRGASRVRPRPAAAPSRRLAASRARGERSP